MMTFSDMWMKLIWEMKVNRNNKNDHRYDGHFCILM